MGQPSNGDTLGSILLGRASFGQSLPDTHTPPLSLAEARWAVWGRGSLQLAPEACGQSSAASQSLPPPAGKAGPTSGGDKPPSGTAADRQSSQCLDPSSPLAVLPEGHLVGGPNCPLLGLLLWLAAIRGGEESHLPLNQAGSTAQNEGTPSLPPLPSPGTLQGTPQGLSVVPATRWRLAKRGQQNRPLREKERLSP